MKEEIDGKFAVAGTLGDIFIVFCKLYRLRKEGINKKITLIHYSKYPEFYPILQSLFSHIENIEIEKTIPTSSGEDTIRQIKRIVKEKNIPFINSMHDGSDDGIGLRDPDYMELEPYPKLEIQPQEFESGKYRIGIQLHSGKVGGNFKGFSLRWLKQIRGLLPPDKYDIYLFGTGAGYAESGINRLCLNYKIENRTGKTNFTEWLSFIKSMNFFITPEGFSAFFAMSQKIRSLVFYTDYQILGRVHPDWRRENIIMSAGQETFRKRLMNYICRRLRKRSTLLAPLNPAQVFSIINGETVCAESQRD